jgi:hypothetical protein
MTQVKSTLITPLANAPYYATLWITLGILDSGVFYIRNAGALRVFH